jgi:hypothetical protein
MRDDDDDVDDPAASSTAGAALAPFHLCPAQPFSFHPTTGITRCRPLLF